MSQANKQKIDSVIDKYGSDITVRSQTFGAKNDFGEETVSSTSDSTIKAVKDNYLKVNAQLNQFGRMSASSSTLIVKADNNFDDKTDLVIFDGFTYNILQVQSLELSGVVLAKLIEIGEK